MASTSARLGGLVIAALVPLAPAAGPALGASPAAGAASTALTAATPAGASRFVPIAPARLLDTRPGGPTVDGQGSGGGRVPSLGTLDVQVTGRTGIAANASAVALNLTAVEASWGYVQVLPTGRAAIGASSNLNINVAGETVANAVVVPVGESGRITIFTQGPAHFVADVVGYFVPTSTSAAGRYAPVPNGPVRLMDTRLGAASQAGLVANPGDAVNCSQFARWADANAWYWKHRTVGFGDVAKLDSNGDGIPCEGLSGAPATATPPPAADLFRMERGEQRRLAIPGGAAGASAVVLNVTATGTLNSGFVQVRPTGGATAAGASSNLNLRPGQTRANLVIAPVGADGTISLLHHAGGQLVVDILGTFTTASAPATAQGLFVPLTPERVLDTRSGPRPVAGSRTRLAPLGTRGLPTAGVAALVLNVTATEAAGPGFVAVLAPGQPPRTSTLNVERAGQIVPNAAVASLVVGAADLYAHAPTHLLADVVGYVTG